MTETFRDKSIINLRLEKAKYLGDLTNSRMEKRFLDASPMTSVEGNRYHEITILRTGFHRRRVIGAFLILSRVFTEMGKQKTHQTKPEI